MTPSNKVLVGKGIIDGLVEYSIWIRIIHWKLRDTVGQQIFEPSFKGRHDTISHWSGGMVVREMLFVRSFHSNKATLTTKATSSALHHDAIELQHPCLGFPASTGARPRQSGLFSVSRRNAR